MIAERGVHGLRVEDVAAAVGVANSLVYYHFGNRAGLLAATMDYNDELAASPKRATGTGYARIERVLLADLGDAKSSRANNIVWNELNAAAVFDDELRGRVADVDRKWVAQVADSIRIGLQDGSIRPDVNPEEAAAILTALLGGLVTRYLAGSTTRAECRHMVKKAIAAHLAP